jgi:hypothetical protein
MTKLVFALVLLLQTAGADLSESLWEAARAGDVCANHRGPRLKALTVDAKSRYDVTPLIFAASSGHLAAVKLLVERGADVNAQDSFLALASGRHEPLPTATRMSPSSFYRRGRKAGKPR